MEDASATCVARGGSDRRHGPGGVHRHPARRLTVRRWRHPAGHGRFAYDEGRARLVGDRPPLRTRPILLHRGLGLLRRGQGPVEPTSGGGTLEAGRRLPPSAFGASIGSPSRANLIMLRSRTEGSRSSRTMPMDGSSSIELARIAASVPSRWALGRTASGHRRRVYGSHTDPLPACRLGRLATYPSSSLAPRDEGHVADDLAFPPLSISSRAFTRGATPMWRTITLSRPRFESFVRERPPVALTVMRLLALGRRPCRNNGPSDRLLPSPPLRQGERMGSRGSTTGAA
jgi:hypothetical protein